MPGVYSFLRCLAEAVLDKGRRGLAGLVPYGELIYDVATDTWERWRNLPEGNALSLRLELQTTAQAELSHPDEFSQQVSQIVAVVASDEPAEVQERLTTYLTMVPGRIRATFTRPEDRRGLSVPGNWQPREMRDLLPFIPPHLPRFKAGDRPPGAEKWELVERLGLGGFGEVWKARHTLLKDRYSAFKFCLDAEAKQRLSQHEARIINQVMSQVDLPGVVKLLEVDYHVETPWLQYDYVAGGELSNVKLPTDVAKRARGGTNLILSIARTLAACHRLNPPVVHRDIKPANILMAITPAGHLLPKITDFGIGDLVASQALEAAKRETRNTVSFNTPTLIRSAHTPTYASPQQQEGQPPSPADDVHALGVMWFQVLMGNFNLPKSHELREDLQDLGLCEGLIETVLKSVAGKVERRFKNAGELTEQIQKLPTNLMKATAPEPPAPQPTPKPTEPSLDDHLNALIKDAENRNALARKQVEANDYAGAVTTLDGIRLTQMRDESLLQQAIRKCNRINELETTIRPRVLNGPHDGLLSLVEELLTLVPSYEEMKRVAERLRQMEATWQPEAESKYTSRVLGIEMVLVPKGAFWMGGGGGQAGDKRVEIAEDFYVGIYPVTQRQWQEIMGNNPSRFKGVDLPVEKVNCEDVKQFLDKLNEKERERGYVFRLPSEEEWEYACRGGPVSGNEMTKEECSFHYYFDSWPSNSLSSMQANFNGSYPDGAAVEGPYLEHTTKVGSYRPNRLGIYDMHGNVWEWTSSLECSGRVRRGASWYSSGDSCRASIRRWDFSTYRDHDLGFRIVRSASRSK